MHEGVVQLIPCHIGILVGLVANNHIGHGGLCTILLIAWEVFFRGGSCLESVLT